MTNGLRNHPGRKGWVGAFWIVLLVIVFALMSAGLAVEQIWFAAEKAEPCAKPE